MKRSELVAMWATIGLLAIGAVFTASAVLYGSIAFWAGAMGAFAQLPVAALAWWGLRLARQQQSLEAQPEDIAPQAAPFGSFRMSYSDETSALPPGRPEPASPPPVDAPPHHALDIGFQRVCVALCSLVFFVLAAVILLMVRGQFAAIGPGQKIIVSTKPLDPGAVVGAVVGLFLYVILYRASRLTDATRGTGEAINGQAIFGLPLGLVVVAAIFCGWAHVHYAAQTAAVVVAMFMVLQGLELLVNALKSYAAIEELDLQSVDLAQLPLEPMLASGWISGLRILLSQSVGFRGKRDVEVGAVARTLPRIVLAIFFGLLAISMLRVVPVGEVAIREHFGEATQAQIDHPLQPGLHLMWPWPIDRLVMIPTAKVQHLVVGTEEVQTKLGLGNGPNGFSLWDDHFSVPGNDFLTGDVTRATGVPSPKMLGGFASIWWRVDNASDFYTNVSHSAFVQEGGRTGLSNKKSQLPIYESMVQQVALYAVTRSLLLSPLNQIIGPQRQQVEMRSQEFMQHELDRMHSGIKIINVAFTDMHPPMSPTRNTPQGPEYGPALAYENVVSAREDMLTNINNADAVAIAAVENAKGTASADKSLATAYKVARIAVEKGKAKALTLRADAFVKDEQTAKVWEMYQTLNRVLQHVTKVVLGPHVAPPTLWQINRRGGLSGVNAAPLPPTR